MNGLPPEVRSPLQAGYLVALRATKHFGKRPALDVVAGQAVSMWASLTRLQFYSITTNQGVARNRVDTTKNPEGPRI